MKSLKRKGFTLTETVLAIGVVGVLIVVFVAMFYPARQVVQAALTVQEADKLVNALTKELSIVRKTERASGSSRVSTMNNFVSAFDKAYYWMQATEKPSTTILIYSYRGDLDKPLREDGTFEPMDSPDVIPGQNAVTMTEVCLAGNQDRWPDLRNAVGPIFAVRMTQFVVENKSGYTRYVLSPQPGRISNPYSYRDRKSKPEEYMYDPKGNNEPSWGAEVMYMAEFFQINTRDPRNLGNMTWEQMKKPVFTRNLIFRR